MTEDGTGKALMQPVAIIASALIGILLGQSDFIGERSGIFIEPLLIAMLFLVFMAVELKDIGRSFGNVRFSVTALLINFVWTPLLALVLGLLFFNGDIDARIGLVMLLVTPCTDWYLVFTAASRGNVALGASILPMNLILQMVLLPVYLLVFFGDGVSVDMGTLLVSVLVVLLVPLVSANAVKKLLAYAGKKEKSEEFLSSHGDGLQLLFLCAAVIAMFASQGKALTENIPLFLQMLVPLCLFFLVNFILAQSAGRMLRLPRDDVKSLNMTTLARNSPLALAVAVVAFPDQPVIPLILVIGPLIELPVLALAARVLRSGNTVRESEVDP